ncbi:sensor histidine kinase [Streptomyces sp. SID5785]|uniref:sensor histidine kinase n=1 Tax=Streptomyces sp. SID5785 TaxID=2690309 RepID=UPI001360CCED|nr:sensor histidine kinase [Streptomyces sp. SID5785]MZD05274.1 sensor histidine kinase [Streptomyces sp. SID5785]
MNGFVTRSRRRWTVWQRERDAWKAENARVKAARKECGEGRPAEELGPPPSGFALVPWLLMGMGGLSNLLQGKASNPVIGGLGLLAFNSLYIFVVFRAFDKKSRNSTATRLAVAVMTLLTCALAGGYGGNWLAFFPLLGLAVGAVARGPHLGKIGLALTVLSAVVAGLRDGWGAIGVAYGTFLSTMVTAAILSLSEAVRELRSAREELARQAVEKERLRFSRDLHDLLGHTLSVIVVKAEAARRLAPRSLDSALEQVSDIEAVGRQALTEIREAVTGYREGSLATELDRARSALTAAGIEPVVRRSGPPLSAQTEALLGWVVREAVTNAVRHSRAGRCTITLDRLGERVRLRVSDDGVGAAAAAPGPVGGTGLKGLTERLASAGGSLEAAPGPRGGFTVRAELPAGEPESAPPPTLVEQS